MPTTTPSLRLQKPRRAPALSHSQQNWDAARAKNEALQCASPPGLAPRRLIGCQRSPPASAQRGAAAPRALDTRRVRREFLHVLQRPAGCALARYRPRLRRVYPRRREPGVAAAGRRRQHGERGRALRQGRPCAGPWRGRLDKARGPGRGRRGEARRGRHQQSGRAGHRTGSQGIPGRRPARRGRGPGLFARTDQDARRGRSSAPAAGAAAARGPRRRALLDVPTVWNSNVASMARGAAKLNSTHTGGPTTTP